ncbi:MAG: porin family protein, partial [Ferruginibacter sp.]
NRNNYCHFAFKTTRNMKTIFITFLSIISLNLFAQKTKIEDEHENFFKFGGKAGVNVNKISGQSYKDGFNYNFQVGGFMQFNFSRRFGLQPEVNFVQGQSEFTNDASDIYNDIFRDGSQKKAKLSYLEIPLLLNLNLGTSKRVKLQLGPSYGALLKQTVDSLRTGGNIYKNGEWSALGGIWLQLPLINMGARYKLGLTNINAINDRQTWKNQSIQIFVGVSF